MDKKYQGLSRDPVVVTGIGVEAPPPLKASGVIGQSLPGEAGLEHDCSPITFLKQRKTLKFMSKQDRLGVNAAGQAIHAAALTEKELDENTGLFLTVGYIPFDFTMADDLCSNSVIDGKFSMEQFSTAGIDNINPLTAFACLPNMPAHHIAMNFGIHGEYMITYPDILQFYFGLEEAISSLEEKKVTCAMVGGIADQNNFLVKHHFAKTAPKLSDYLADAAAFLILERESSARTRNTQVLARLKDFQLSYSGPLSYCEEESGSVFACGPAQLVVELFAFLQDESTMFTHNLMGWGNTTGSKWEKP